MKKIIPVVLALLFAGIYFVSSPKAYSHYDYTFRIAQAFLGGHLGVFVKPPDWLNEMVRVGEEYYSVFPFGSVLTMVPFVLLNRLGIGARTLFPSAALVGLIALANTLLAWAIATHFQKTTAKKIVLALFLVLGNWSWANLAFGGAWQVNLGFAMLGQMAALYFILVRPNPWCAGAAFAFAFGHRTEIILLAPVFWVMQGLDWKKAAKFCTVPFILGVLTLLYNVARFGSPLDFGYARIPGVLDEPWYRHGIFSFYAIPLNAREMLFTPMRRINEFPYFLPTGFGGSIFLFCPFLFLLFRPRNSDHTLAILAWTAVAILTLVLWCHGNPGGWQISYRYAMVLLPWFYLIFCLNTPPQARWYEWVLMLASVVINALAMYLFLWTPHMSF